MPLSILQFVDSENTTTNFSVDIDFFESPISVVVDGEIDLSLSFFKPSDYRPCFFVNNVAGSEQVSWATFSIDIVIGDNEMIVTSDDHIFMEFELIGVSHDSIPDGLLADSKGGQPIVDYEIVIGVDASAWWPPDAEALIPDENSWIDATSSDTNSSAYWG